MKVIITVQENHVEMMKIVVMMKVKVKEKINLEIWKKKLNYHQKVKKKRKNDE